MPIKARPTYKLSTRDHFKFKVTETESEGMGKVFCANRSQKKTRLTVFISDKMVFKPKAVPTDKEVYYKMIK